jgi:hypothetical protein
LFAQFRRKGANHGFAQRLSGICAKDAPSNHGRAGLLLIVPRRRAWRARRHRHARRRHRRLRGEDLNLPGGIHRRNQDIPKDNSQYARHTDLSGLDADFDGQDGQDRPDGQDT